MAMQLDLGWNLAKLEWSEGRLTGLLGHDIVFPDCIIWSYKYFMEPMQGNTLFKCKFYQTPERENRWKAHILMTFLERPCLELSDSDDPLLTRDPEFPSWTPAFGGPPFDGRCGPYPQRWTDRADVNGFRFSFDQRNIDQITQAFAALFSLNGNSRVRDKFEEHGIVPDLIGTAPFGNLTVRFGTGPVLQAGGTLLPKDVQSEPEVHWPYEDGAFYTLSMSDLDAPSRSNRSFRSVDHWLVVNIPGNDIKSGTVMAPYIGSLPDENTGSHRYALLAYRQNGEIKPSQADAPLTRLFFSIAQFARKFNLGNPVAGNFFLCQFDSSTPSLSYSAFLKAHQQ